MNQTDNEGIRLVAAPGNGRHQGAKAEPPGQLLKLQSSALEACANAVVITDTQGGICWVNSAFTQLTGYWPNELIGRNLRLLKSGRHDPEFYKDLWQTIRAGRVWSGEIINRRKDGSQYVEDQTITPVRDDSGAITHFIGVKQDVTEARALREALRESESLYQATFNEAPVGITHTALDGRFLRVNRKFCEMLEYSAEELLQLNFKDVTQAEEVDSDGASAQQLLSGAIVSARIEKRYLRKDGSLLWANRTISLQRDRSGRPLHFITVVENISERKQAQETLLREKQFFDTAIDALPGIFYLFDCHGRILRWNRNFERVLGYSSAEIGKMHPRDFFGGTDRTVIEQKIGEVLEKGQSMVEAELVSRDGRRTPYFLIGARVLRDETPCVIGTGIDLSETKKLEAQFLRTQRLESIGTLASGIAHDLNNILAPILMAEQLLRMRAPGPEYADLLDTIAASAQRGAEVVKQVLTYARGVEGEKVLMQLGHLIREMEKIARETFPRTIAVRINIAKDLWPITGDATKLHQVLLNLCVNARDAMPSGGTLTLAAGNTELGPADLRLAPDSEAGPYVVLEVKDTGTGIPANIVDKIFDPFFTTKEHGKGTGLGLSTVVGIVKSHSGFVTVASEVGKGTSFQVFLPAVRNGNATAANREQVLLPRGCGELVLVVDDEAGIRDVTRSMLERNGYEVLVAADGTEAVALIAQLPGRVNLVLTDIMMPFMDGIAMIRALRKMDPRIQIVASSGLEQSEKMAELKNLSVTTFLDKPYTAEKMLVALHELLHPPSP